MFSLTHIAQRNGSQVEQTTGVSDVQTVEINGGTFVFVTSQENGLITSYKQKASGGLTYIDQLSFTAAGTPAGIEIIEVGGSLKALPTGYSSVDFGVFDISESGHFLEDTDFLGDASDHGNFLTASVIDINGSTYVYGRQTGDAGIVGYKLDGSGALIDHPAGSIDNSDQTFDAVTSVTADVAGLTFLFVPSQSDNSITSYWIKPNGVAKFQSTVGVEQNLGIAVPTDLQVVTIADEAFVLMASAGSSSITVLRVLDDGNMIVTDHVIDELTTRFQNISVLEVAQVGDRAFVVAGGADDGLTLLELMPNGTLLHHTTIADELTTSLGNVSGVSIVVSEDQLTIYAGGPLDAGLSQFVVDLDTAGQTVVGTTTNQTYTGTSDADVLYGGSGNDTIEGKGGADILMDGAGQDTLIGGNGADIFVLSNDKQHDVILDFKLGTDQLDLSNYELLRNLDQIKVTSHSDGATLSFFQETLRIHTHNNSSLDMDDLIAISPISLSHMMIGLAPQNLTIDGSALDDSLVGGLGNDQLLGLDGNDILQGGAGADWLEGGLGDDCADYSLAILGVTVSLSNNAKNTGEAQGDVLVSVEHIVGSDHSDKLIGDSSRNDLFGGNSSDILKGKNGRDTLYGNKSGDELLGQNGRDKLFGGNGQDTLKGGAGRDTLEGGRGNDHLSGGAGNDTLLGGRDADTFIFESGADKIKDFEDNIDQIDIDADLLSNPSMSASELVQTYGSIQNGAAVLDFGGGDILTIDGVTNLNHLNNDIEIF